MARAKRAAALATVLVVVGQTESRAQQQIGPPSAASSVAMLGANAMTGSLTAGVRGLLEGEADVSHALLLGALGGSLNFAGKRIAVESWKPSPLIGRLVNAVGSSIVLQASSRSGGLLDSLQIPVGPIAIHLSKQRGPAVSLNLNDLVLAAGTLIIRDDLRLDWGRSLRALTPVFVTTGSGMRNNGRFVNGVTHNRVIVLNHRARNLERTFAHETVHVLQQDFVLTAWDQPLERAVRTSFRGGDRVPPWLHVGIIVPLAIDLENRWLGDDGFMRVKQAEAKWFERWHSPMPSRLPAVPLTGQH